MSQTLPDLMAELNNVVAVLKNLTISATRVRRPNYEQFTAAARLAREYAEIENVPRTDESRARRAVILDTVATYSTPLAIYFAQQFASYTEHKLICDRLVALTNRIVDRYD